MLLILCHAGGTRYAIRSADVAEVVPRVRLHSVPGTPPWFPGLLVHRGQTVPVLDLGHLLAGEPCANRLSSRILLVAANLGNGPRRLGILVESVGLGEEEILADGPESSEAEEFRWGNVLLDRHGVLHLLDLPRLLSGEVSAALLLGLEERA